MIRRYGPSPRPGQRHRVRAGAYALLRMPGTDDLLLTATGGAGDAVLQLPGGGVDAGESPIAALHREVLEETGWIIAAPRLWRTARVFVWMADHGMRAEKLCGLWIARPVRRVRAPSEPGHRAVVLPRRVALHLLESPADRAAARDLPGGRAPVPRRPAQPRA